MSVLVYLLIIRLCDSPQKSGSVSQQGSDVEKDSQEDMFKESGKQFTASMLKE